MTCTWSACSASASEVVVVAATDAHPYCPDHVGPAAADARAELPLPVEIRAIPEGCFCSIIREGAACLACTCILCGAFGRYGSPIWCKPTCPGE